MAMRKSGVRAKKGVAHDIKSGAKKMGKGARETMEKAKEKTKDVWEDIKD